MGRVLCMMGRSVILRSFSVYASRRRDLGIFFRFGLTAVSCPPHNAVGVQREWRCRHSCSPARTSVSEDDGAVEVCRSGALNHGRR